MVLFDINGSFIVKGMLNSSQLDQLSQQFLNGSVEAASGDAVWVEYQGDVGKMLADHCAAYLRSIGAEAFVIDAGADALKTLFDQAEHSGNRDDFFVAEGEKLLQKMQQMQGYIRICDRHNVEAAQFAPDDMMDYRRLMMKDVTDYRVKHTRWLIVDAPTAEFAASCRMDQADFDRFYFNACMADYSKMRQAVKPLEDLMTRGRHVHITGQDTDIQFSIEGIPAQECTGTHNIPDGECFTAPVRDSVNGKILYGPSSYLGIHFPWIKLECEAGRVIAATSETDDLTQKLNGILDTDAGARYFGEFAIGFNPSVTQPVGSILFDEKIAGSFHLTPGQCYEDIAPNGNKSAVHWDMVKIQRPEFGGGDIIIDDELIRRDGLFVRDDLKGLNPENLR